MAQPIQRTYEIDSVDTVPASETLSGTWSAASGTKALTGTSGSALTQVQGGWWIYDPTNGEVRQIEKVTSDNYIVLKKAFSNVLSGATLKRVTSNGTRRFSVTAVGGDITMTDSYDDVVTLAESRVFNDEANYVRTGQGLNDPFVVDPDGNAAAVSYRL